MKTNDIFVAPIKKYAPPKYPTHTEARFKPELLRKLPSRWQKNAAIIAAAGLFGAMSLTSCGFLESDNSDNPESINLIPESKNFLNVAPVFIHGDGTGSVGCVMVVPPVFLFEQEALAVIKSIAENEGLHFNAEPLGYIAVQNKGKDPNGWINEDYVLGEGKVGLDLYDAEKGVAVTYISMAEAVLEYKDENGHTVPGPTVTGYLPRELAELTVEDFAQQNGDINIGVLYEPGYDLEAAQSIFDEYILKSNEFNATHYENAVEYNKKRNEIAMEYEKNIKLLIEENLRAQFCDFIEWLQGQGII